MRTHKKIGLILVIAMLSSIMAFAVVAEEGIAPHIDCDHPSTSMQPYSTSYIGNCRYQRLYREECNDCGRVLGRTSSETYTSHTEYTTRHMSNHVGCYEVCACGASKISIN